MELWQCLLYKDPVWLIYDCFNFAFLALEWNKIGLHVAMNPFFNKTCNWDQYGHLIKHTVDVKIVVIMNNSE